MTATFREASREIHDLFKAAWDTTGHPVDYEGVKDGGTSVKLPPTSKTNWARVTLRHIGGGNASLVNGVGQQLFNRTGLLTVQIFTPVGKGFSGAYDLAKIVTDSFEGEATSSAIWFRNVRINEIGRDGNWMQLNVLIDFTYDERK